MIFKIKPGAIAQNFAFVQASNATQRGARYAQRTYVCDGTADDVEIMAALAAYDSVVLSDGDFNLAATITTAKSIFGNGIGSTKLNQVGSLDTAIECGGSQTQLGGNDATGAIVAGTNTIPTTADFRSSLAVGDYFYIASNIAWNNERGQYTKGEWHQVAAITANSITTEWPILLDYDPAGGNITRLYKGNLVSGLRYQGFTVNYGTATETEMFDVSYAINALVSDVRVDGGATNKLARRGITFNNSLFSRIQNSVADNVAHLGYTGSQIGYGFYFSGCYDCSLVDSSGTNNKHLFDADKSNYQAISQKLLFQNIEAYKSIGQPLSTHGGAYDVTLRNCNQTLTQADNDNGFFPGMLIRSVKNLIEDCTLNLEIVNTYCARPINIGANPDAGQGGTGGNGSGIAGQDVTIRRVTVNIDRRPSGNFTSSSQGNFIDFDVPAKNVVIENCNFSGLQNTGILFRGNTNDNIRMQGNTIAFAGARAGENIVAIEPQVGSALGTNVSFIGNTVTGAPTTASPYVAGAGSGYVETGNTVS